VVVTSPNPLALKEASYFCERLREFEMPLAAVVVNRVHESALGDAGLRANLQERLREQGRGEVLEEAIAAAGDAPELIDPLLRAFVDHELQAAGDHLRIDTLRAGAAKGVTVAEVPQFSRDVYDLSGLKRVADTLFGGQERE
jgi:anion-transporting  ArsA/GET3 family ATPase